MIPSMDERIAEWKSNSSLLQGSLQDALTILRRLSGRHGSRETCFRPASDAPLKNNTSKMPGQFYSISDLADKPLAEAYSVLAYRFQNRKNYKAALSLYKVALQQSDKDGAAYEGMGDCYLALGNEEEAQNCYQAAVRLRPDSLHGAARLAEIHLSRGELNDAQEILKLTLLANPNVAEIHIALGAIHKCLGSYERAIAHFRQATLIDKNNAKSYNELGECFLAIGLFKQAEPYLTKALKTDGSNLLAMQNLGMLYYQIGKFEQAASVLQRWLKEIERSEETRDENSALKKQHLPILDLLAKSYAKSKQRDKAEEIWRLSIAIKAEKPTASRMPGDKTISQGRLL